jgi:hypothetical protein
MMVQVLMRNISESAAGRLLGRRPRLHLSIVLAVTLSAAVYGFREQSLFACPVSGYGSDVYLAYCGSTGYGDYDYGAFWFGLEPTAKKAAAEADVLFLGNSRMQFGLSSGATSSWFAAAGASHYLLGFAYDGNYKFIGPLLARLKPKARVYVINLDLFFEEEDRPPSRVVKTDTSAPIRYQRKRQWQAVHRSVCAKLPLICDDKPAFFRSRDTGSWHFAGRGNFTSKAVSFDEQIDEGVLKAFAARGERFLAAMPVRPECQILTMVPTVNTPVGTAKAIATALKRPLVAPQLTDLQTFDESHLDTTSAEQWSSAFFLEAAPVIRSCLATSAEPGPVSSGGSSGAPHN